MVKFGNIKCEKCGEEVNKKKLKLHKCSKAEIKRVEQCSSCGKGIPFNNFNRHYTTCRAKMFWRLHMSFFLFFLRVIRAFNRELKKNRYLGCLKAKKRLIEEQTYVEGGKVDLRKNQKLLSEIVKVEEDEALRGAKIFANEEGLAFEDAENLEALKDSISYSSPGLSCRQIIFDFLKNKGIDDKTTLELIEKKLFNRDYPTDEELQDNEYLFNKIKKLRVQYDYHTYYERFYYMLLGYYENRDTYQCHFCKKFFLNMKGHLKRCKAYKKYFYDDEEKAIEFYLNTFYKATEWRESTLDYYVSYYKQYSFNYFIETIGRHLKDRKAFIDKNLEGRRKFRVLNGLGWHYSFRDLVAEIDAWKPPCFNEEEPPEGEDKEDEVSSLFKRFEAKIDEAGEEEESKNLILPKDIEEEKEPREETLRKTWGLLLGDKFKQKKAQIDNDEDSSSSDEDADKLAKASIK